MGSDTKTTSNQPGSTSEVPKQLGDEIAVIVQQAQQLPGTEKSQTALGPMNPLVRSCFE